MSTNNENTSISQPTPKGNAIKDPKDWATVEEPMTGATGRGLKKEEKEKYLFVYMKDFEAVCTFGHSQKRLRLCQVSGASGIQVYLDNFYQGVMMFQHGEWICLFNDKSWLTGGDIRALSDIIELFLNSEKLI